MGNYLPQSNQLNDDFLVPYTVSYGTQCTAVSRIAYDKIILPIGKINYLKTTIKIFKK